MVILGGSVVCSVCSLVMDRVNSMSAAAACLDPMTPNMYVHNGDDGGVNRCESLNIDFKLLITP